MTYKKLKQSRSVHNLAYELGFKLVQDPVAAIVKLCDTKIQEIMQHMPECDSLDTMLAWVANKVGTKFEAIDKNLDIESIKEKYLQKRELGFLELESFFTGENDLGVTIKLAHCEKWEPQFISVIDSRGKKAVRSYFTKWHEIAHILTAPNNYVFNFSHASFNGDEPIERLMDLLAGRFGFYMAISGHHMKDKISFNEIESLRKKICPQASRQSTLINFAKFWKSPCILIHAEPAYKSAEKAKLLQRSLFPEDDPIPELRATHVTCSEMAREIGFTIFQNMQVPHESIIYKLYESGQHRGEASENLSWWKSITKDTHLPDCKIKIEAMRTGNAIDALLTCL